MVEIRNKEDLEKWLEDKPPQWIESMAVRSAVRVLPILFGSSKETVPEFENEILFKVVRTVLFGYSVTRFSISEPRRMAFAIGNVSTEAYKKLIDFRLGAFSAEAAVIRSIYRSGHSLAVAASSLPYRNLDALDAIDRAIAALSARGINPELLWAALTADCSELELWKSPWENPLWKNSHVLPFSRLNTSLAKPGLFSSFWSLFENWYNDRLDGDEAATKRGRPPNREMEFEIATIPNEDWDKGPEHVFEVIKAIQEKYWGKASSLTNPSSELPPIEAIPNSEPLGATFEGGLDTPLTLRGVTLPDEFLEGTPARKEDYQEIRLKAEDLRDLGTNRLGCLMAPVKRLLELPEDVSAVRVKLFWMRLNKLRIALDDHNAAPEDAGDERRLEPVVASWLRDLVEAVNVFVLGDARLMDFDAARPGPRDGEAAKDEVARVAGPVRELAATPAIAEDATVIVSEELANAQQPTETLSGRQQAEGARRTIRNFIGSVVRAAYRLATWEAKFGGKEIRAGAYRLVGTALAMWVFENAASVSAYLIAAYNNPQLKRVIEVIVTYARGMLS